MCCMLNEKQLVVTCFIPMEWLISKILPTSSGTALPSQHFFASHLYSQTWHNPCGSTHSQIAIVFPCWNIPRQQPPPFSPTISNIYSLSTLWALTPPSTHRSIKPKKLMQAFICARQAWLALIDTGELTGDMHEMSGRQRERHWHAGEWCLS